MTKEMWGATKTVSLPTGKKDEAGNALMFTVTVKHVGSPEDPLLLEQIDQRDYQSRMVLEAKARRALIEAHGSPQGAIDAIFPSGDREHEVIGDGEKVSVEMRRATFEDAVDAWSNTSPDDRARYSRLVSELVTHGVVDGEKVIKQIWEAGQSALLKAVAREVRAFNSPDPKA